MICAVPCALDGSVPCGPGFLCSTYDTIGICTPDPSVPTGPGGADGAGSGGDVASGTGDGAGTGTGEESGGGCTAGGGSTSGMPGLALALCALAWALRRRRRAL